MRAFRTPCLDFHFPRYPKLDCAARKEAPGISCEFFRRRGGTVPGNQRLNTTSRKAPRISKVVVISDVESSEEEPNDSGAAPVDDTEADDTDGQDLMDVDQYESIKDLTLAYNTSLLSQADPIDEDEFVGSRQRSCK
ncbi:hypothetical protein B0H13DRAFT_1930194 [Mycena leptocephala]|nr:hypothetical protein B0H13DRAFT_1930194 [Mycena leptocephala]